MFIFEKVMFICGVLSICIRSWCPLIRKKTQIKWISNFLEKIEKNVGIIIIAYVIGAIIYFDSIWKTFAAMLLLFVVLVSLDTKKCKYKVKPYKVKPWSEF